MLDSVYFSFLLVRPGLFFFQVVVSQKCHKQLLVAHQTHPGIETQLVLGTLAKHPFWISLWIEYSCRVRN